MPTGIGGEIGWWCQSLDDSGNGTTTLNDLIGSSNGTLTNFALTGSTSNWVADTESGGVRCLDYDGSNDFVAITRTNTTPAAITLATWVKTTTSGTRRGIFAAGGTGAAAYIDLMPSGVVRCAIESGTSFIFRDSSSSVNTGAWVHIAMTATTTEVKVWVNGSDVTTGGGTGGSMSALESRSITLGKGFGGLYGGQYIGRQDDSRLFHSVVSAGNLALLASRRAYQKALSDFETAGMFGGMSGAMTGGMTS